MSSHRTPTNLLIALALVALMALGCTLAPDEDGPASSLVIRVEAAMDATSKSAAADLIDDAEFLSGRATIWSLPEGLPQDCDDVCDAGCLEVATQLASGPLVVSLDESTEPPRLLLDGDLSFELDSPGSLYRLDVDLQERGRRIQGLYAGDIVLGSGLEVQADTLRFASVDPVNGIIGDITFCMDTDIVELDPEERCVSEENEILGVWDPDLNQLVMTYVRNDVQVEGTTSDSVLVRFDAELQPATIYTGCAELGNLAAGAEVVEVTISLEPTPETGPGLVGEELAGDLVINLYTPEGEVEVSETGRVTVQRTESLSPPTP